MKKQTVVLPLLFLLLLPVACTDVQDPTAQFEAVALKARPLPLSSVRLTGGPLKNAQDLDAAYLLELEPDRMLALLRQHAELEPKAENYGGWDGPDRQITGHIAGHYLSAVSLMWAATGDIRFQERADYIVQEMKEIQDQHGDGYLGAQTDREGVYGKDIYEQVASGEIRPRNFDLNGLWSPWYVQHKLFAGLRDAYRFAGNSSALDVEIRFAAWVESLLSDLDDEQIQHMLAAEFGGMNEIAADLYADTGDSRWLALSDKFHHRAIVDSLASGIDVLPGKHGNTQVPKLLGTLKQYIYSGNQEYGKAARFFWDQVANHHSFATGGHGHDEYFQQPDQLNDMVEGRTAETCNVYNMVKLSRTLFSVEPDIRIADFHERALFNHILASIDPEDGRTCYMVPVGNGVQREYQNMTRSFTCCVGSGMESHALHGLGIYYESDDRLWVNLYASSTADWESMGVHLVMETDFPEGESASLSVNVGSPKRFILALRRPSWAGAGFEIKVNGNLVENIPGAGSYVALDRTWRDGDRVEVTLHKTLHLESLPDNGDRVALMWGPLVLAGDMGPEQQRRRRRDQETAVEEPEAPIFSVGDRPLTDWFVPIASQPGTFQTRDVGLDQDVEFVPFYRLHRRRYGIYWDLLRN